MLRSPAAAATRRGAFAIPGAMLALAALVLVALTFAEWRAMAARFASLNSAHAHWGHFAKKKSLRVKAHGPKIQYVTA